MKAITGAFAGKNAQIGDVPGRANSDGQQLQVRSRTLQNTKRLYLQRLAAALSDSSDSPQAGEYRELTLMKLLQSLCGTKRILRRKIGKRRLRRLLRVCPILVVLT